MINPANLFRLVRYGLVGAIGTLAHYAILISAVSTHIATPVTASMAGAVAGAIINYILNAKYTFDHRGHAQALPKFALIAIAGALMNGVLMEILTGTLGLNYLVAQVVTTVIVLGLTYTANSLWTFRRAATTLKPDNMRE